MCIGIGRCKYCILWTDNFSSKWVLTFILYCVSYLIKTYIVPKEAGSLLGILSVLLLWDNLFSILFILLEFYFWAICSINYSSKTPTSEVFLPLKGQVILSCWKNFKQLKIQLAICQMQMWLALFIAFDISWSEFLNDSSKLVFVPGCAVAKCKTKVV